MKEYAKSLVSKNQWKLLSRKKQNLLASFSRTNLTKLAQIYGSDKWGQHYYTPHYQNHFKDHRKSAIQVLEIGIGGYESPEQGGSSLRMWKSYFPKAVIHGIDIHDKSPHAEDRIQIHRGSQVDEKFLSEVVQSAGGEFDIIIDDGSHLNEHVIDSFKYLFPYLKEGGVYAVEDTQTSYWPRYGGQLSEKNCEKTMMGFFKGLVDGLNYEEYRLDDYQPTLYDQSIVGFHFYHNLVFINKGKNLEGSNILGSRY